MEYNRWQVRAAERGTVTSGSDFDGYTLDEVYDLMRERYDHAATAAIVYSVKTNRLYAQVNGMPHIGPDQAFAWLVESGVSPYAAARRVWGYNIPKDVYQAIEAVASKLNAEHRQSLEDARMAG